MNLTSQNITGFNVSSSVREETASTAGKRTVRGAATAPLSSSFFILSSRG
jgi:hypothetical protein